MSERDARGLDEAAISAAWKDALAAWDVSVTLSPPLFVQTFYTVPGIHGTEPLVLVPLPETPARRRPSG